MNNKVFLKKIGIKLSGNVDEDNKTINEFFGVGQTQKIEAYIKQNGKMKRVNISPVNYQLAFCEEIWKTLSVGERLKVFNWHQEQYLTKKGYRSDFPTFEFLSRQNYENLSFSAIAKPDGKLMFSFDFVEKCKGYEALVILTHESEHFIDFEMFDSLYYKHLGKYIKHTVSDLERARCIMELPVEGKIKNLQTGEWEFVSNEMRNEFLLMKNCLATFGKRLGTPEKKRLVATQGTYENYLEQLFYFTSPLEYRAQYKSISYATKVYEDMKENSIMGEKDKEVIDSQNLWLKKIEGKIREIQKLYNCSYYNALNMELVSTFNENLYGKAKSKYVCPKLVAAREEKREYIWESKMGYIGDYKPYDKGGEK